jgi:FK506-binding nuclear protein
MAAIDPDAEPQVDESHKVPRATLKLIRVPMDFDEDDEDDDEDYEEGDIEAIAARLRAAGALPEADSDMSDSDESENEKNGGPSDPAKSKKAKQAALTKKLQQDLEADDMEIDDSMTNGVNGKSKGKAKVTEDDLSEEDSDEEDDEDEEIEELVLCTLDPERVRRSIENFACISNTRPELPATSRHHRPRGRGGLPRRQRYPRCLRYRKLRRFPRRGGRQRG